MNDTEKKIRLKYLTDDERAVYDFMRRYLADNSGVPPTMREIAEAVSAGSTSSVSYRLRTIEAIGLIVPVRRNRRTYYTVRELADWAKELSK